MSLGDEKKAGPQKKETKELKNHGFHIGGSSTNVEKTQYWSFFMKSRCLLQAKSTLDVHQYA